MKEFILIFLSVIMVALGVALIGVGFPYLIMTALPIMGITNGTVIVSTVLLYFVLVITILIYGD